MSARDGFAFIVLTCAAFALIALTITYAVEQEVEK